MNLTYIITVNLIFAAFMLLYILLLRKGSNLLFNRIFLILSIPASLTIPSLQTQLSAESIIGQVRISIPPIEITSATQTADSLSLPSIIQLIYISVTSILLLNLLLSVTRIAIIKKNSPSDRFAGIRFFKTSKISSPASFFRLIFIPDKEYSENELKSILKHERTHAEQFHSADILLSRLFGLIFWFNPAAYLHTKLLSENHEYSVDKTFVKSENLVFYINLLVQQSQSARGTLLNRFTNSLILNRLKMMKQTSSKSKFRVILTLPLVAAIAFAFAPSNVSTSRTVNTPVSVTQQNPEFPGGEIALKKFIAENLNYPESARKNKQEDNVFVQFTVDKTGKVKDAQIVKGKYDALNEEALRVINLLPDFKPAQKDGEAVDAYMTLPIVFRLS